MRMVMALKNHSVNPDEAIAIEVVDQPGAGGAYHRYDITGFDTDTNPSSEDPKGFKSSFSRTPIIFQNGPVKESGFNGITIEALLAICEHRLECFQAGPFASDYNQVALDSIKVALDSLHQRTRDRMERQVEGLNIK